MKANQWIVSFIWLACIIGVLSIPRSEFYALWGFYSAAFAAYAWLVMGKTSIPIFPGLLLALICRLATFYFEPLLSDDYFRFIWDGMVMHEGISPAGHTPSYLVNNLEASDAVRPLYGLLNSKEYYSVYPPAAQLFFYISFAINHLNIEGHIIFYKAILLFADAAIIALLGVILRKNNQSTHRILIYALNPLMIIEYMGNLHMEGFMIAGLLAAIVFANQRTWLISSLMMTFSISSKMLSLLLMPFMPREMYWKRLLIWGILTFSSIILIFWLFFGLHTGWMRSVTLWFQSFEFNASLYYLAREIHGWIKGYDHIQLTGPLMAVSTILMIFMIWIMYLRNKQIHWSSVMVITLTIYFLMSTTIHPWYLGMLFVLSIISGHTFPMIWTYVVFLSYSHYTDGGYSEKYIFIWMEYLLLFLWMGYEIRKKKIFAAVADKIQSWMYTVTN